MKPDLERLEYVVMLYPAMQKCSAFWCPFCFAKCACTVFLQANDAYLQMAIGNAPWPIGVTMVGIHARTGREKIFSKHVAHVLNDETQRKYIQVMLALEIPTDLLLKLGDLWGMTGFIVTGDVLKRSYKWTVGLVWVQHNIHLLGSSSWTWRLFSAGLGTESDGFFYVLTIVILYEHQSSCEDALYCPEFLHCLTPGFNITCGILYHEIQSFWLFLQLDKFIHFLQMCFFNSVGSKFQVQFLLCIFILMSWTSVVCGINSSSFSSPIFQRNGWMGLRKQVFSPCIFKCICFLPVAFSLR